MISSKCLSFKPRVKANANSNLGLNSSIEVLYLKQIWNILSSTKNEKIKVDKSERQKISTAQLKKRPKKKL